MLLHPLLEIITVVSQPMEATVSPTIIYLMIFSGTVNSVKMIEGTNTPLWFSVSLPGTTNDDIEVRICHDQDNNDEDTPIQLLELYVQ